LRRIGILAIQGDFEKHKEVIKKLGHTALEIRNSRELYKTDALIIPGGESTTFRKVIDPSNFDIDLKQYAVNHPIMGTCAGLILLAREVIELPYPSLKLIDITVQRNAYGRQRESFIDNIALNLNGTTSAFLGVFIRAPKIIKYGNDVQVLATHDNNAVLVTTENILTCTFHPELTDDIRIHQYFLNHFLR
jgi:5'-phosphate synthase pdxT subunit